ncbi:hypothetical protein l11_15040 [Neisseria weaveri LMG 5135]|nr:hypothetical protein l13_16360 [Neisseria weaveri ATCC 51223]EGV36928.1 hypothetical protein l11_15040 [Neisseria weaveri LMG 5135]
MTVYPARTFHHAEQPETFTKPLCATFLLGALQTGDGKGLN